MAGRLILINAVFSFWQEFKAERPLQALAGNLPPPVGVWRDGYLPELRADQLECGDRVALKEGDQEPPHCRVVEADQLYVDLSVLTGESLPVVRDVDPQPREGIPTRERTNLLLAGSTVASGRGEGWRMPPARKRRPARWPISPSPRPAPPAPWRCRSGRNVHSITLIALGTGLVSFVLSVLTAQAIACQIGLLHPRRGRRRPPPAGAAATAATPARAMARARRPMRRG